MRKLIFLILLLSPCVTPGMVIADNYYIGHWVWSENSWVPPVRISGTGQLDLRSNSQCAIPGPTPQGWGLFAYSGPQSDPNLVLDLGTNLNATISVSTLTWLKNNVSSAPIAALTIKSALWAIMNSLADPTGVTKVKNIMPDNQGNLNLLVAGNVILSKRVEPFKSPEWANILKQHQLDYATIRHDVEYAMLPPNFHREQLSYWSQLYGVDYHVFIPEDLPDESPIDYGTTQSENFNCADNGTTINCQQTWTEINADNGETFGILTSSGYCNNCSGGFNYWRAEADVASANHVGQLDITQSVTGGASYRNAAVMMRFDSGPGLNANTETGYIAGAGQRSDGSDYVMFDKAIGGTITQMTTNDTQLTIAPLPGTVKGTCNGSNMKLTWKGTDRQSFTDTSISTGTRGGVFARNGSGTGTAAWDNWSLTDLAAGGSTPVKPRRQRTMIY